MYCTHCGTPLEPGAKFCRQCGIVADTGAATEERLNKGMVIASVVMVSIMMLNILIGYVMRHGGYSYLRSAFFVTGLLACAPYFILAYHSTMQKYKTLLIILGCIMIFWDLFSWIIRF